MTLIFRHVAALAIEIKTVERQRRVSTTSVPSSLLVREVLMVLVQRVNFAVAMVAASLK